jgi:hypothetical protein
MRAEGKTGSDILGGHPELSRGSLDKPSPPPTLSEETDRKAADTAPSNPEHQPRPWFSSLVDAGRGVDAALTKVFQPISDTLTDFDTGATHGATAGFNDDLAEFTQGKGGQARVQAYENRARGRSPIAYQAGDVAGSFLIPTGLAGKAAGVFAPIVEGAIQAGARGFGDSEGSVYDRAMRALSDASIGGTVSGGVAGLANGVSGAAQWAAKGLKSSGDKARAAAVGASGADLRKLADERGLDFVENDLGSMPDRLGVTNKFVPQSPSTYARKFDAKATEANNAIGQAIDEAATQGVDKRFVDKQAIINQLRGEAVDATRSGLGDRAGRSNAYNNVADALGDRPVTTPRDLRTLKSDYDKAYYTDAVGGTDQSFVGDAHRVAGNAARGQLRDAMSYALPDTRGQFTQANLDYGSSKLLGELAQDRAATQFSGGGLAGNIGAGAVGAAVGGMVGGMPGVASGAAIGFARPALAAAQQYGPDFGANLARLGESGARGVSAPTGWFGGSSGPRLLGGAAGEMSGADGNDAPGSSDAYSQASASENSRGQDAPERLVKVMLTEPQLFKPYQSEFDKAPEGDSEAIFAIAERLARDPKSRFNRDVWSKVIGSGQ